MSRFAVDPRWLLYLPPTMSPVATSTREGLLEHPEQAFAAYQSDGVPEVLCEEKHMGSRAVLLICRTSAAARPASASRPPWPRLRPIRPPKPAPPRQPPKPAPPRSAQASPAAPAPETGRRLRRHLDPDRPAVLPRCADRGPGQPGPRGGGAGRAVQRAGHPLAAARRRTTALERQGRPVAPRPVRRGRGRRPGLAARRHRPRSNRPPARAAARRRPGGTRPAGPDPRPDDERRRLHRRLPALLLVHRRPVRRARRPVPAARLRGRRLPRASAPVAPGDRRPPGRRRPGPDRHHPPAGRRRGDPASVADGHPLVGGPDRGRGRGHGGQARRQPDPRSEGSRPARA